MPLVNAVRVVSDDRRVWVENSSSISQFGRHEGVLEAGGPLSIAESQVIGTSYLLARAFPAAITVAEARGDMGDIRSNFTIGDTIEVNGTNRRCKGITRSLAEDGTWRLVPEFDATDRASLDVAQRQLRRLTSGLGSAAAVPIKGTGRTAVKVGKIGSIGEQRWSWTDLEDLEDDPWQPLVIGTFCSIVEFRVDCDFEEEVDGVMEQVATGTTGFTFSINGVTFTPQPTLLVGPGQGSASIPLWPVGLVGSKPGDVVRPRLLKLPNQPAGGGHINGSLTVRWDQEP
jgi:hypothetical protein